MPLIMNVVVVFLRRRGSTECATVKHIHTQNAPTFLWFHTNKTLLFEKRVDMKNFTQG